MVYCKFENEISGPNQRISWVQLKWELSSTLLGVLIGKYLPHDTYTVYKMGSHLRVDGALKGVKPDAASMLPQWKYGAFSLIIDTNDVKRGVLYVDHVKKRYMRVQVCPCPYFWPGLSTGSKFWLPADKRFGA